MNKFFISLLMAFMYVSASAQLQYKDTRNLNDFNILKVFGNIKVDLIKSDSTYIILESDVVTLDKLTTKVEGTVLTVKSLAMGDKKEVFAKIYYKSIEEITADGGANIAKTDTLRADKFTIKVLKGSLARVHVVATKVEASVGQGAELRLLGRADELDASAGSGGLFDGFGFTAKMADVKANTGGKINVLVTDDLRARANSGGAIVYKGKPKKESVDPSMGGSITKL